MPWKTSKIGVNNQSGLYVVDYPDFELTSDGNTFPAKLHVSVTPGDVDRQKGEFFGFHVTFDANCPKPNPIHFYFEQARDGSVRPSVKGTTKQQAETEGILEDEYNRLKIKAAEVAGDFIAHVTS